MGELPCGIVDRVLICWSQTKSNSSLNLGSKSRKSGKTRLSFFKLLTLNEMSLMPSSPLPQTKQLFSASTQANPLLGLQPNACDSDCVRQALASHCWGSGSGPAVVLIETGSITVAFVEGLTSPRNVTAHSVGSTASNEFNRTLNCADSCAFSFTAGKTLKSEAHSALTDACILTLVSFNPILTSTGKGVCSSAAPVNAIDCWSMARKSSAVTEVACTILVSNPSARASTHNAPTVCGVMRNS